MKLYRYFYAAPDTAAKLSGIPDVTVWFYTDASKVPIQAKPGSPPPAGVVSAMLAAPTDALDGAIKVDDGSKDPIPPPPPPPPSRWSLADYLADPVVKKFFASVPRGVGPGASPVSQHALVVQITGYPTVPLPDVADADDIAAVLRDPELCGYPPGQVRVLKDQQATRAGLLAAIDDLAKVTGPDSTVLFYYSGHGGQVDDATYIVPFDADMRDIPGTGISAADLANALGAVRAAQVLLVFDCCHAGGLEAKDVVPLPVTPGLGEGARAALIGDRDWVLFAASDAGELSYVQSGARNGIFTKHFLAGLRGEVASNDEHVRVFGLYEYLQPLVTLEEPRQHPRFKCEVKVSFPIARYRGGTKAVAPTVDEQFEYHALLSFARADAAYVRTVLAPALTAAGLRIATASEDIVVPGMHRVLGLERGLDSARRTVVVVSAAYLKAETAKERLQDYAVLQRKYQDIVNKRYSIVPAYIEDEDSITGLPLWLGSLAGVHLGPDDNVDANLQRLIKALKQPLPTA